MLNHHQYWIALFMIFHASAGEWVSKPADMRLCSGEDAELRWDYEEDDAAPVEMIFWMHGKAGETMMVWYAENNSTKVYNGYKNRVERIPGTKAGIVLRNVSVSDTGEYNIEVGGPGWRDGFIMNIHQESNLVPTILVDNEETEQDEYLDKSSDKQVAIAVNTGQNLDADISISTQDKNLAACTMKQLCSAIITFSELQEANISVAVDVDYGVCKKQGVMLTINTGVDKTESTTPVEIALIVTSIIVVILGCLIGFWFILRRRYLKEKELEPWQITYTRLPCFYVPFTKFKTWKSIAENIDKEKGEAEQTNKLTNDEDENAMNPQDNYFGSAHGEPKEDSTSNEPFVGKRAQNKSFKDKLRDVFGLKTNKPSSPKVKNNDAKKVQFRSNSQCSLFENVSITEANEHDDYSNEQSSKVEKPSKDITSKTDVTAPVQHSKINEKMAKTRKSEATKFAQRKSKGTKSEDSFSSLPMEFSDASEKSADSQPAAGPSEARPNQSEEDNNPADAPLPEDNSDIDEKGYGAMKDKKTADMVTKLAFVV